MFLPLILAVVILILGVVNHRYEKKMKEETLLWEEELKGQVLSEITNNASSSD